MDIRTSRETLLPDPSPRPVRYTVISVDDHLVEPPDMFEGRLPARWPTGRPAWSRPSRATRSGSSTASGTRRSG